MTATTKMTTIQVGITLKAESIADYSPIPKDFLKVNAILASESHDKVNIVAPSGWTGLSPC